ncbi:MAG: exosortase C-terminal domain/associated protein EpsI, partial [Fimbriimonadales bacterium]
EAALRELQPDEYLARIYVNAQGEQADLSIIAGSHTGAFHSPQVCFRVQNWEFADNREISLNVPGLAEPIKARFVELVSLRGDNQRAVGIYFYSTPFGYRSDTSSARIYLLAARLAGMNSRSYFVRFLKPASGNAQRDRESIQRFAEAVLAEMVKTNPEVVR